MTTACVNALANISDPAALGRLLEAVDNLIGDEDECYEPGKALVLSEHMRAVAAAYNALTKPQDEGDRDG